MGKRKHENLSDNSSNSDYEWVESSSKSNYENDGSKHKSKKCNPLSKEIESNEFDELHNMLNSYSSKSNSEIRSDKKEALKSKENKLYEDRLYKPKESNEDSKMEFDFHFLKKSYFRSLDQAKEQNVPIIEILRERYDDKTIDFMMKKFAKNNYNPRVKKNYFNKDDTEKKVNNNNKYFNSDNTEGKDIERKSLDCVLDKVIEERFVTNDDINEASAALMRAEFSNDSDKIKKCQKRMSTLQEAQRRGLRVKLTRTKPVESTSTSEAVMKTMKSGKYVPYLEHGSRFKSSYNVQQMQNIEKYYDADDMDKDFIDISSKNGRKLYGEDDCEAEYNINSESISKNSNSRNEHGKAVNQHKIQKKLIDNCKYCEGKIPSHMILTKGQYFCLIVPLDGSMNSLHCQIVPIDHVSSIVRVNDDEDAQTELKLFKERVCKLHKEHEDSYTVFMEAVGCLKSFPHCRIDCLPIKYSKWDKAQMKFRKAMEDLKDDKSVNKGLLKLKKGGIRRTIAAEMRYFAVEFGANSDDGFAVVIENDYEFKDSFGLDVMGDVYGLNIIEVRQKKKTSWEDQSVIVLAFEKKWKHYSHGLDDPNNSD